MNRKRIIALISVGVICSLAITSFIAFQKFFSHQSLRAKAVKLLSQCVKGEVTVGEVDFNPFRGISIRGLNISDPTAGNKQPILRVSRIFIEIRSLSLLFGKFWIKRLTITSPEVFIVRTDKGNWNIREFIRPDFKLPFVPVEGSLKNGIVIKDAEVSFRDLTFQGDVPESISGIQVFLSPSPEGVMVFNISGNINDKFWGDHSFSGKLNLKESKFNLTVLARNILLREELFKSIPSVGAKIWDNMTPSGRVDLTCTINYDSYADRKLCYDLIADVKEGAFKFKQWPLPIHSLIGTVELCDGCVYLKNLKGKIDNEEDATLISFGGDICLDERGGILTVDVSNVMGTEELVRMIALRRKPRRTTADLRQTDPLAVMRRQYNTAAELTGNQNIGTMGSPDMSMIVNEYLTNRRNYANT